MSENRDTGQVVGRTGSERQSLSELSDTGSEYFPFIKNPNYIYKFIVQMRTLVINQKLISTTHLLLSAE